jgi:hypothetical protein
MTRPFTLIAAILFALMALAHAYRLVTHFKIMAGSHLLPMWLSIIAILVTAILAVGLFREARR